MRLRFFEREPALDGSPVARSVEVQPFDLVHWVMPPLLAKKLAVLRLREEEFLPLAGTALR